MVADDNRAMERGRGSGEAVTVTFGGRLRELREKRRLSQAQLAQQSEGAISAGYISLLEADKRSPSKQVVALLASLLECSVPQLLEGRPSEREDRVDLELRYARLAVQHGEAADAKERLRRLQAEGGMPQRTQDEIEHQLGLALVKLGELAEAIEISQPLFDRACHPEGPNPTHLLVTLLGIRLTGCYVDAGDLARAIEVGERALAAAAAQGLASTHDYFRLAATVQFAYVERGDLVHSQVLARRFLEEAAGLHQFASQAVLLWNASLVADRLGHTRQALGMAERALGYLGEHEENGTDFARLRLEVAGLLLRQDPPDIVVAADLLRRCEEILQDLGHVLDRGRWHLFMASVQLFEGDPGAAETHARQACELLARMPSTIDQPAALAVLSDALAAQDRPDPGLLQRATSSALAAKATRWTASAYREIAERLVDVAPDLAISMFRAALDGAGVGDRGSALRAQVRALRERPTDRAGVPVA